MPAVHADRTTSAPAARSSSRNSGTDPSRRWRRAAAPRCAGRRCRPRRGSAQLARRFGLRRPFLGQARGAQRAGRLRSARTMRALPSATSQLVGQPPAVGRRDPAAEPDACGGDHNVGRHVDQRLGVCAQLVIVRQRHHGDRGRAGHGGAAALQQRAQFLGASGGGHRHPKAGERCPVRLTHVLCVVRSRFQAITSRLPRHVAWREQGNVVVALQP